MKARVLVDILRDEAAKWNARGNLLPGDEDAVPYGIAEAFVDLADAIDLRVEEESEDL